MSKLKTAARVDSRRPNRLSANGIPIATRHGKPMSRQTKRFVGAKGASESQGKEFLQEAFHHEQLALSQRLELAEKSITHQGKRGDVTERHFITALRAYLPKRYAVDSAIVIDSTGKTSDQMDVVIYDPQYTPTLLDQHDHKYVPAEAVYTVMEVKPTVNKSYLDYAGKKAASVRRLKRTSIPIPHAGGTYPAKPLFEITAGLIAPNIEWADGFVTTFLGHHAALKKKCGLDCVLALSSGSFDIFDASVNHAISPGKNALVFFLFRLLQKLQSLGTVPPSAGTLTYRNLPVSIQPKESTVFDYNEQVQAYEADCVNLLQAVKDTLRDHREANRNRLKRNRPETIRLNNDHFIPQGSMAIGTTVQEENNAYDIDDGVWFHKDDLKKKDGTAYTARETQETVRDALKDSNFNKQPELHNNCVRVFYAEGHHVDVRCYRKLDADSDKERQELAGANGFAASDPTEINRWFLGRVEALNKQRDGAGSQLRVMIRLTKRFARSRGADWDMPNGLKLTMLVEEGAPSYYERDDEAFYWLLSKLGWQQISKSKIAPRPRHRATSSPNQQVTPTWSNSARE